MVLGPVDRAPSIVDILKVTLLHAKLGGPQDVTSLRKKVHQQGGGTDIYDCLKASGLGSLHILIGLAHSGLDRVEDALTLCGSLPPLSHRHLVGGAFPLHLGHVEVINRLGDADEQLQLFAPILEVELLCGKDGGHIVKLHPPSKGGLSKLLNPISGAT
ncbi:hypothetical protein E2562_013184 [Oryza meyeriana var. granulata]|uniref:Uncharacterized protein n=1 Tax=Oryza meyeriana var. granulata TaxID=110450 RepID=A0A6G1DIL3_9ORYZ|nr:hypothetical protein E2562_013184 [Oryza meyeriana var. granulata]